MLYSRFIYDLANIKSYYEINDKVIRISCLYQIKQKLLENILFMYRENNKKTLVHTVKILYFFKYLNEGNFSLSSFWYSR